MAKDDRIEKAVEIANRYGGIDGAHHKQWVIDQMVRILVGHNYPIFVAMHNEGEDGHDSYSWDVGIAP